uniref:ATP synthase complex subunit 8 n=1 Tax=Haemodracon trachyrhinus TaxID=1216929 RepID=A0A7R7G391_9SAUR|nr:ATPase subunit 8 [Haemodracon trachyrhinus]
MPQLHPGPWFLTFTAIWVIISLLILPTLLMLHPTSLLNTKPGHNYNTAPWTWPWL